MTTDFAVVPPDATAAEAIELLRDQEPESRDRLLRLRDRQRERLLGVISLRDLLTVPAGSRVRDFMTAEPDLREPHRRRGRGHQTIAKYNLLALPVVDADGVAARHRDDRRRHRPRAAPGLEETIAAHLPVTR